MSYQLLSPTIDAKVIINILVSIFVDNIRKIKVIGKINDKISLNSFLFTSWKF